MSYTKELIERELDTLYSNRGVFQKEERYEEVKVLSERIDDLEYSLHKLNCTKCNSDD